jgi:hypothetical protein
MNMDRKRIFIDRKTGTKQRTDIIKWAAQHNYDTIVIPLNEKISAKKIYIKLAKKYELNIEAGGHELSLLLPRRLFMFHSGLFRMEQGRRKSRRHFCPTNPKTTAIIAKQAAKLFSQSMQTVTEPRIFHLLPDQGHESIWCSCPACRAFSPAEQNIIAVNCAADALAKIDPEALLSYIEFEATPVAPGVVPRKNMFVLKLVSD